MATAGKVLVAIALLVGLLVARDAAWAWVYPPPVTCEVADARLCDLTLHAEMRWITGPRPESIRVYDVPARWRSLTGNPRFSNAEWAARFDLEFDPEYDAACYRESESHAVCYLDYAMDYAP
ncbi:MAG: hypothetical protein ABIO99_07560 [Candidatus Limnocylindria bacterium]